MLNFVFINMYKYCYEEGRNINMSENSRLLRGIKQRKNRFFAVLKIALVFYLMIFSIKYVTSSTAAHFTSSKKANVTLTAGTWADNSKLAFIDKGNINLKACPAKMEVTIKNISDSDMKTPSKFEIYYIDKDENGGKDKGGNPKIQGTKIDIPEGQDVIPPLASGEQTLLSFVTNQDSEEGFYTFYAYQTNKSVEDVWSVKVKVKCQHNQSVNEQSEAPKEETPKESVENENTETPETKAIEETGSDKAADQTPENNEQTSTNKSGEIPGSNSATQTQDAVNNSVPDETINVEGNKEKDEQ
ncbi:amyloid fiber anchoring/assembly protein TapA [Bacillus sp. HNG]|nr:amyloid fiber anchoring/assembly protein TapA [Bacillus sp. HNG]